MQQSNQEAYGKTAIRIAPHLHQQLKERAAKRGTTMQDLAEYALIKEYGLRDRKLKGAAEGKR